jgi:hopanoid biosynthesis associated glycosyl transferase protein HpnI
MAERSSLAILRGALVAATAASIGYQIAAMLAARRWQRRSRAIERAAQERPIREVGGSPVPPVAPSPRRPVLPTPVSILKPVRGLEPHAERSFTSFCVQDHPDYELLFGVADPDDPAAKVVRKLAERYPAAHVRLVTTGANLGPNRKVCNLHGLAEAAHHDLLLISDSDMRVAPDYLRRIVVPFRDPRVGLVTCPYRGAEPEGVPAALEALGIATGFMPGVFVAALGGGGFAFGSTIALRRETLERIGGFAGLVDYLADDYQMGKRVADLGRRVHLSSVVVESVLGRRSLRESWTRRLRWARTVRACRPLGHLGSGLTHTTALALLTAAMLWYSERKRENAKGGGAKRGPASRPGSGPALRAPAPGPRESAKVLSARKRERCEDTKDQDAGLGHMYAGRGCVPAPTPGPSPNTGGGESASERSLSSPSPNVGGGGQGVGAGVGAGGRTIQPVHALVAAALVVRFAAAWRIVMVELESDAARRWFPLLPLSDLVEAALWLSSLFGRTVRWRGQRYRLLEGGRIERLESDR